MPIIQFAMIKSICCKKKKECDLWELFMRQIVRGVNEETNICWFIFKKRKEFKKKTDITQ